MTRYHWLCLLVLVSLGCAASVEKEPVVDLQAERQALLDADRALYAAHTDIETFSTFWDAEASFLAPGAPPARGEAIRGAWEALLALPGFHLEWEPTSSRVAEAGDLGYTLGSYALTVEEEGTPMVTIGKYVTIWNKQSDGSWKVIVDCFNDNGAPAGA